MRIFGINPVLEALKAGQIREIRLAGRADGRIKRLTEQAERSGVPVRRTSQLALDREAEGRGHQGVVADTLERETLGLEDLLRDRSDPALFVVLDGVEDPQNLGAILRTANAAGVDGVVVPRRRSAPLSSTVARASAGAMAHVRIAQVVNVARALEDLKSAGVWTVGLSEDAAERCDTVDLTVPTAFVLGGEGHGLRRLVRERCDFLVRIPMQGQVSSLNVSVAAGIALFEAVRQRLRQSIGEA